MGDKYKGLTLKDRMLERREYVNSKLTDMDEIANRYDYWLKVVGSYTVFYWTIKPGESGWSQWYISDLADHDLMAILAWIASLSMDKTFTEKQRKFIERIIPHGYNMDFFLERFVSGEYINLIDIELDLVKILCSQELRYIKNNGYARTFFNVEYVVSIMEEFIYAFVQLGEQTDEIKQTIIRFITKQKMYIYKEMLS